MKNASVLVVDDVKSNRLTLVKHIKKLGISKIYQAENGRQALDLLSNYSIDIVVLDIMMPEVDGYQVLEQMKDNGSLCHTAVIMITAIDDMDSAVKCIETGAEDYLLKPFNPVMLRARVNACLEKKRLRDIEREYLEMYDSTTGLVNRKLFLMKLSEEIDRYTLNSLLFGLLLIRLTRYRMILESVGQGAANDFLVSMAERVKRVLRKGTLLARVGDNEFAIILTNLSYASEGDAVALKVVSELEKPLNVGKHEVQSNICVGVVYNSSAYDNPSDMLRDAGLAASRTEHRGGFQIFDETMHQQAMRRLNLEREIYLALADNQLVLFYQPIVALNSGAIDGFEALIRWEHPMRGMLLPDEFMQLTEETDLIIPVGAWVLSEACRQAAQIEKKLSGKCFFTISVNVSAHQFTEPDFLTVLKQAIKETGIMGSTIKLELTETALIENPDYVENILREVQRIGIKTALDDFGTGYCSLNYLHRFPFNTIKIDQTFIHKIEKFYRNREIVHSTILLAHKLGMDVVAEGIETAAEAEVLRELNCDFGQGHLFKTPVSTYEVMKLLDKEVIG